MRLFFGQGGKSFVLRYRFGDVGVLSNPRRRSLSARSVDDRVHAKLLGVHPLIEHSVAHCQQRRADEDTDESERRNAAKYSQKAEHEWQVAAFTDNDWLQYVVHHADAQHAPDG